MSDVSIEDIEKAITTLKELSPQFGELGWSVSTSNVIKYLEDELDRRKKPIRSVAVFDTPQQFSVYISKPDGSTLGVFSNPDGSYETLALAGPNTFYGTEVWSSR